MNEEMTSAVEWKQNLSKTVKIQQGVRQGGVLSLKHYKRHNNLLLIDLGEKFRGATIVHVRILHTKCANDLAVTFWYRNESHGQNTGETDVCELGAFQTNILNQIQHQPKKHPLSQSLLS